MRLVTRFSERESANLGRLAAYSLIFQELHLLPVAHLWAQLHSLMRSGDAARCKDSACCPLPSPEYTWEACCYFTTVMMLELLLRSVTGRPDDVC